MFSANLQSHLRKQIVYTLLCHILIQFESQKFYDQVKSQLALTQW
jgi:hypothetical protein